MPLPEPLEQLKEIVDDLETRDDWAYRFVTDMLIKFEENENFTCSKRQFFKLVQLRDRYVEPSVKTSKYTGPKTSKYSYNKRRK